MELQRPLHAEESQRDSLERVSYSSFFLTLEKQQSTYAFLEHVAEWGPSVFVPL